MNDCQLLKYLYKLNKQNMSLFDYWPQIEKPNSRQIAAILSQLCFRSIFLIYRSAFLNKFQKI